MRKYHELLRKNSIVQNSLALEFLLDYGRRNLTNDEFCKAIIDDIKKSNNNNLFTIDYQLQSLNIAKDMARLETKELCKLIHDYTKILSQNEKNKEL